MNDHQCKGYIAEPQNESNVLNFNILKGSTSEELMKTLSSPDVQRLLLDMAKEPRTKDYIESSLNRAGLSLNKLLKLKLISQRENVYVVNLFLFTEADQYRMDSITESHATWLAHVILQHRPEIEEYVKDYTARDVDQHAVLYLILGCFSLDWDGLALSAQKGVRTTDNLLSRIFPKTIIYAWEPTALTKKKIYCGSHNSTYGGIEFTSFGDHQIQPRKALPDFFWNPKIYGDPFRSELSDMIDQSSIDEVGKETGTFLISLRNKPETLHELAMSSGISETRCKEIADFLIHIGYITSQDNYYHLRIPVLSSSDTEIVRRLRDIGREEMEAWYTSCYSQLHSELSGLTPFKYGLKQEEFFYNVWHDIFGKANRILVESGLFADPYSDFYGAAGIIPLVFNASLYSKKQ